jgi:hypothetical protein
MSVMQPDHIPWDKDKFPLPKDGPAYGRVPKIFEETTAQRYRSARLRGEVEALAQQIFVAQCPVGNPEHHQTWALCSFMAAEAFLQELYDRREK